MMNKKIYQRPSDVPSPLLVDIYLPQCLTIPQRIDVYKTGEPI